MPQHPYIYKMIFDHVRWVCSVVNTVETWRQHFQQHFQCVEQRFVNCSFLRSTSVFSVWDVELSFYRRVCTCIWSVSNPVTGTAQNKLTSLVPDVNVVS